MVNEYYLERERKTPKRSTCWISRAYFLLLKKKNYHQYYQYYQEPKERLSDYRRNYYLTHKK